jgi:hypothetical protein
MNDQKSWAVVRTTDFGCTFVTGPSLSGFTEAHARRRAAREDELQNVPAGTHFVRNLALPVPSEVAYAVKYRSAGALRWQRTEPTTEAAARRDLATLRAASQEAKFVTIRTYTIKKKKEPTDA